MNIKRLRELLDYDQKTGELRWKINRTSRARIGDVAGCADPRGYIKVRVDGRLIYGHRIAWGLHYGRWPKGDLDHRNLDKGDNRIVNLRLATRSKNLVNTVARGKFPKGVYPDKGRFRVAIWEGKRWRHIGMFDDKVAASAAFASEHQKLHGEFSRV